MNTPRSRSRRAGLVIAAATLLAAGTACAAEGDPLAPLPAAATFVLQLGVLMALARAGGTLFERLRLPPFLGELSAGIVLGPCLAGQVPLPGLPHGLTAGMGNALTAGSGFFAIISFSLMTLLFLQGLETDVRLVQRYSLPGILVGLGGSAATLAIVAFTLHMLGPAGLTPGSPAGLLFAIAAAASSVGVAARTLARLRRLESPEGVGVMAAVVVDNLAAVLLLALAAGYAMGRTDPVPGAPLIHAGVRMLLAVAITAAVAMPLARWLSRGGAERYTPASLATFALAAALVVGGAFGHLRLAAPVGAYLVGLALATTEWRHPIQERLEFVHAAFMPTTFAILGMQLQPAVWLDPRTVLFSVAFVAAAVAAKLIGCALPAALAGFNLRGCLRLGIGLMPRGETTVAIVGIALLAGAMPPAGLAAIVLLLFATGLAATPAMTAVFAAATSGVRKAFATPIAEQLSFHFPSHSAAHLVVTRLIAILEEEGFFVHLLNRRESLYQLSKDDVVIGLHREGSDMVVDCTPKDRSLVNTAMVEVLAGIERNLRELRRPLDSLALRKFIQSEGGGEAPPGAVLRGAISAETLRPRLLADDKAGVITELLDLLDELGLVRDRHDALNAVMSREEGLSTGLQHGIAIPHGRTDAVDRLVCAVGLKQEGIDFGSFDGRPTQIVVLLLAPASAAAPQLQFISQMSQLLNEQGRAALMACDTAEDMYAVLTQGAVAGDGRRRGRKPSALGCLRWSSIALDMSARTREEVVDQLMALCSRSGAISSPEEARQAVLARERKSPTGMDHGVALPHARTEAVDRMVCAVGISRNGVDFGAMDGQPSRIFVMVLMPPSTTTEYTRLTATLMRALDNQGREAVLAAHSSQDVLDILTRGEQ